MLVRIFEYFFFNNHAVPTLSFISFGACIVFIYIFNRKHCWAMSDYGVQGVINSTWYEVIVPALIWLGSAVTVVLIDFGLCQIFPHDGKFIDFVCFNQHIDLILSRADTTILVSWTLIGLLVCIFRAGFLEVTFRGLCFGVFRKKMNFYACNSLQSLLYVIWFLVLPIRAMIFNHEKGRSVIMILIFSLAQFLFAYTLGYIRLVCGTLWPGLVINTLYNFITFNFVFSGVGGEKAHYYVDNARWVLVNLIALICIIAYCKWLKKKFPPPQPDEVQKKIFEEELRELQEDE